MEDIIHYHRLQWIEKIARMPLTRLPCKLLTVWVVSPDGCSHPHGRRILPTHDSFLTSLRHIGIDSDDGNLADWIHLAKDRTYDSVWKRNTEQLLLLDKLSQVEFLNTYQIMV